jgi:hypothetical protein
MPPHAVSVERLPGRPPVYTVQLRSIALVQFTPESDQAGPTRIRITFLDMITDYLPIDRLIVTEASDSSHSTEQQPVTRLGTGQFVADVVLQRGNNRIVAIARTSKGTRIRAGIVIPVT